MIKMFGVMRVYFCEWFLDCTDHVFGSVSWAR